MRPHRSEKLPGNDELQDPEDGGGKIKERV